MKYNLLKNEQLFSFIAKWILNCKSTIKILLKWQAIKNLLNKTKIYLNSRKDTCCMNLKLCDSLLGYCAKKKKHIYIKFYKNYFNRKIKN